MNSLINTPGRELMRLMGELGYSEKLGDLCGVALDKAIGSDPRLAANLLGVFSTLQASQLDRNVQRGKLSPPGFCRPPKETLGESRTRFGATYSQRERIDTYNIGEDACAVTIGGKLVDIGARTTPADFEKRLLTEAAFRRQIEKQIGGRIVLGGAAEGKIRVAKREAAIQSPSQNTARTTSPDAAPASNGDELSGILNDPSLSFELKIAMFLFAFLEKKQKDLEQKVDALQEMSRTVSNSSGSAATSSSRNPIDTMELNQEMQEMNQLFSFVNHMLKSMNSVAKQEPPASAGGAARL